MKKTLLTVFLLFVIGGSLLFLTSILASSLFVGTYIFIVQPNQVAGRAMEPTYSDGAFILTEKITYKSQKPKRGDIIIFTHPVQPEYDYIKRIIGLPGETIMIRDGNVYINNEQLSEPYITQSSTLGGTVIQEGNEYSIPQNNYFVLGDNRSASSDSRDWGFVPINNINGKVYTCYANCK